MNLGTRIVIVGVSASGKSTFARKLAAKLAIPLTLVDTLMWKPGWNYIGDEETQEKLKEVGAGTEWIIEGYITKGARTFLFDRADTIIYLDYPPFVAAWRYVKRWWKHRKDPRPELPGCPETWDFKFLKLVWNKGEAVSLNKFLAMPDTKSKLVRLTSPKHAKRFLEQL